MEEVEKTYPGLGRNVEVIDVASPMTYVRYTGNWRGSPQGWFPVKGFFGKVLDKKLPGLSNFYMAGHWLLPGGAIHRAAQSGRNAVQQICRDQGEKFQAKKI